MSLRRRQLRASFRRREFRGDGYFVRYAFRRCTAAVRRMLITPMADDTRTVISSCRPAVTAADFDYRQSRQAIITPQASRREEGCFAASHGGQQMAYRRHAALPAAVDFAAR